MGADGYNEGLWLEIISQNEQRQGKNDHGNERIRSNDQRQGKKEDSNSSKANYFVYAVISKIARQNCTYNLPNGYCVTFCCRFCCSLNTLLIRRNSLGSTKSTQLQATLTAHLDGNSPKNTSDTDTILYSFERDFWAD